MSNKETEFNVNIPVASLYKGMYESHYNAENMSEGTYVEVKRMSVRGPLKNNEKLFGSYTIIDGENIVNYKEDMGEPAPSKTPIVITVTPANPVVGQEVTVTTNPSENVVISGVTLVSGKFTPTVAGKVTITATPTGEAAEKYKATTKSVTVTAKPKVVITSVPTNLKIGGTTTGTIVTNPANATIEVVSGTAATVSGKTVTAVEAGSIVIKAKADGYEDSDNKTITVAAKDIVGPTVSVSVSPTSGTSPTDVTVTATVTKGDGDITTVKCGADVMTLEGGVYKKTYAGVSATTTYSVTVTDSNNKTANGSAKFTYTEEAAVVYYGPIETGEVCANRTFNAATAQTSFEGPIADSVNYYSLSTKNLNGETELSYSLSNKKMIFLAKKEATAITHYNVITQVWDNYMNTFDHCVVGDEGWYLYVCKDAAATSEEKLRVTIGE